MNSISLVCLCFLFIISFCCPVLCGTFDFCLVLSFSVLFFLLCSLTGFSSTLPSDSCCSLVFVLYPCCTHSAVNNMHKYMLLDTDSIVYLWNFPNPNASLLTLKKSSINPLSGFKSVHFLTCCNNIFLRCWNVCLSSLYVLDLYISSGYEILSVNFFNVFCTLGKLLE